MATSAENRASFGFGRRPTGVQRGRSGMGFGPAAAIAPGMTALVETAKPGSYGDPDTEQSAAERKARNAAIWDQIKGDRERFAMNARRGEGVTDERARQHARTAGVQFNAPIREQSMGNGTLATRPSESYPQVGLLAAAMKPATQAADAMSQRNESYRQQLADRDARGRQIVSQRAMAERMGQNGVPFLVAHEMAGDALGSPSAGHDGVTWQDVYRLGPAGAVAMHESRGRASAADADRSLKRDELAANERRWQADNEVARRAADTNAEVARGNLKLAQDQFSAGQSPAAVYRGLAAAFAQTNPELSMHYARLATQAGGSGFVPSATGAQPVSAGAFSAPGGFDPMVELQQKQRSERIAKAHEALSMFPHNMPGLDILYPSNERRESLRQHLINLGYADVADHVANLTYSPYQQQLDGQRLQHAMDFTPTFQ